MSFVSTVLTYIALNDLEILMPSVDSVDIYSIYSNAIVYCVWYLVCWHCPYKDQSTQCIECYVYQHTSVCGSYTTPYTEYYEVWKHQYQQSQPSIAFNALHALIFISTVLTNKIPYSIHNSIALIVCIDHLNMPFTVMYIQTIM